MLLASPAAAQEFEAVDVPVPSGTAMTLYDVRVEAEPPVARFRLVSAAIDPAGEEKTFGDLIDDLQYVCDAVVIPSLAASGWDGESVVISVSQRETPFGIFDETVTQFFQPYRIEGDACVWDDFHD